MSIHSKVIFVSIVTQKLYLFQFCGAYSCFLQVLQLTKFDYRLANDLDEDMQKLRCRVNYNALRFTKRIQSVGMKVVKRMRKMAKRFIAVHLRFSHFRFVPLISS